MGASHDFPHKRANPVFSYRFPTTTGETRMLTYLEQIHIWNIDRYRKAERARLARSLQKRPRKPRPTGHGTSPV